MLRNGLIDHTGEYRYVFFFQAEDGIRDLTMTGVQTCALPISRPRLSRAKEPGARAYAASVVGAWASRLPNALELLRPLVADEHPRVRLQAVVACTYVTNAQAMEVAAVAADFPADKFLDYALKQAVFALKPYWLPAFR